MATQTHENADQLSEDNVWYFVKSRQATELAPLKVLQKFVLSLNKYELTHIIGCYLKAITKHKSQFLNYNYKHAIDVLLNQQNQCNSVSKTDKQILFKMNAKYGNKYNKKVLQKIQQKPKNKINLLSIHPQVLSKCFQYLSYKELCKMKSICVCFTYVIKKYPSLSHYYLKMDKRFCIRAMTNVIDLNALTNFKHIEIAAAYNGESQWCDKNVERKSILYKYILKQIITQSIKKLEILTIDINGYVDRSKTQFFNVLSFIMHSFNSLPINKLFWKRDVFCNSRVGINSDMQNIFDDIRSNNLMVKFPKLQHFIAGSFSDICAYRDDNSRILSFLNTVMLPYIQRYKHLQSLELDSYRLNPIELQHNDLSIIKTINKNMKQLKKLTIRSWIQNNAQFLKELANTTAVTQSSLEELNIKFDVDYRTPSLLVQKCVRLILNEFFSTFTNVKTCTIDLPRSVKVIEFIQPFSMLFRNKVLYSMEYGTVNALQSLNLTDISYTNCKKLMNALIDLKNETFFDLKHFGIDTMEYNKVNDLIENDMVSFINKFDLLTVTFACNRYIFRHSNYTVSRSHLTAVLKLLSNISESMRSINIQLPIYGCAAKGPKLDPIESKQFTKKLCQILSEKTDESKLQTIILNRLKLSSKSKEFLTFMFGYNNKLLNDGDKYHFTFI